MINEYLNEEQKEAKNKMQQNKYILVLIELKMKS